MPSGRWGVTCRYLAFTLLILLPVGCRDVFPGPGAEPDGESAVTRGRATYQSRRCINCHGADALGKSTFPGAPRIVGRTAGDIRQVLMVPCDDPADISNCHPLKMQDLRDGEVDDLAAYLGSLAGDALEDPGPVCDDVSGHICTIAGNGVAGSQGNGASLARRHYLYWPQNVAVDPQQRPVITDWNNYTIRRVENTGCQSITDNDGNEGKDCPIISLIGTGALGDTCSTESGPARAADAQMNHPVGVLYDDLIPGQSNIILWGWHQWKIKYIPIDGEGKAGPMLCLWGNERGATADDLPAGYDFDGMDGPTRFNLPSSAVYDNAGNFYISDQGNLRIRIIRPDDDDDFSSPEAFVRSHGNNIISSFAGGLIDDSGNFRRTRADYSDSGDGGPASACTFNVLSGFDAVPQFRLALDRDRNLLYVADSENGRIRVIDLNTEPPIIDTFAGGGADLAADGVDARSAMLLRPADVDVAPDGSGDVLITDSFNHCVRLVDYETRTIRTVAGVCGPDKGGYAGDGGPATQALLHEPGGSAMALDRTIYIADTLNHRVRRVNP